MKRFPAEAPLTRRRAGLLVPVFAMRHRDDFGIGDTRAVRETIDFCAENSFAVLQMLPVLETFGDHSPYNPICSRALSPAYISLAPEEVPGLLTADLERAAPADWLAELRSGIVRHGSVHALKMQVLRLAWRRFRQGNFPELEAEFRAFEEAERAWLPGYTLFRLLVREYEGNALWPDWRPEHRTRETAEEWLAAHPDREPLGHLRESYAFVQWIAHRQWSAVRDHADRRGVMLMGEISFGVGLGSADVWGNPDLFDLGWNLGTGPLAHFDTAADAALWGQNWGLPAYRWENHRADGFAWLRSRIEGVRRYSHLCRLDHLRGYFRSYQFPWPGGARHSEYALLTPAEAAVKSGGKLPRFIPGPDADPAFALVNERLGREIIAVIREAAGPMELVAELMGNMPDYMKRALVELPLANLVFPQLEQFGGPENPADLKLRDLGLATYANHDNAPLAVLYPHLRRAAEADPAGKEASALAWLLGFARWEKEPPAELDDELLAALQAALFDTPCMLAVLMCGDLLGIPQRFNLPGTYGIETWCERLEFPLAEYARQPVFDRRVEMARELIARSGRAPLT